MAVCPPDDRPASRGERMTIPTSYQWVGLKEGTSARIQSGRNTVVPVIIGPPGPAGSGSGSGASYTHTQNTPSAVWVISHNLGFRPDVIVYDSAGDEVLGDVSSTTNTTTLTFSGAFTGVARLT